MIDVKCSKCGKMEKRFKPQRDAVCYDCRKEINRKRSLLNMRKLAKLKK